MSLEPFLLGDFYLSGHEEMRRIWKFSSALLAGSQGL